jgi:phosphatidylinositol kinase/protein kinase (PI-3  family)
MATQNDPLAELITSDATATDRQKLTALLKPFAMIDENTKEFSFHEAFNFLGNSYKIEIALAAAKARALFFKDIEDGLTPGQLINLSIMPEGSIKSTLKRLYDSRKIGKDKSGRYLIPAYHISNLFARINKS